MNINQRLERLERPKQAESAALVTFVVRQPGDPPPETGDDATHTFTLRIGRDEERDDER